MIAIKSCLYFIKLSKISRPNLANLKPANYLKLISKKNCLMLSSAVKVLAVWKVGPCNHGFWSWKHEDETDGGLLWKAADGWRNGIKNKSKQLGQKLKNRELQNWILQRLCICKPDSNTRMSKYSLMETRDVQFHIQWR